MGDVNGPIHTLPGAGYAVPDGTMCDDHPERPATHRVQGETDSFGCEMNDFCEECYQQYRAEMKAPQEAFPCDYCRQPSNDRRPIRDYDEGMCGPVYYVCGECRRKAHERAEAEASESGMYDDYDYDDDLI